MDPEVLGGGLSGGAPLRPIVVPSLSFGTLYPQTFRSFNCIETLDAACNYYVVINHTISVRHILYSYIIVLDSTPVCSMR